MLLENDQQGKNNNLKYIMNENWNSNFVFYHSKLKVKDDAQKEKMSEYKIPFTFLETLKVNWGIDIDQFSKDEGKSNLNCFIG